MNLGWPQLIYLALLLVGLGHHLDKDGTPKTGNHDFFTSVILSSITLGLL
jgi:hypothetical protein